MVGEWSAVMKSAPAADRHAWEAEQWQQRKFELQLLVGQPEVERVMKKPERKGLQLTQVTAQIVRLLHLLNREKLRTLRLA